MQQGKDIISKYKTWLRLEKSLSANSIDAYLTDLDKLTRFIERYHLSGFTAVRCPTA